MLMGWFFLITFWHLILKYGESAGTVLFDSHKKGLRPKAQPLKELNIMEAYLHRRSTQPT